MESVKKYFRIDRRNICFVKFIFEAYENLAALTTIDSEKGLVLFQISPGCENFVEMILKDLETGILIEPVAPGPGRSGGLLLVSEEKE